MRVRVRVSVRVRDRVRVHSNTLSSWRLRWLGIALELGIALGLSI